MLITSLDNERVRRILNLHNRHWREQTWLYLIEGYNLVREALEIRAGVEMIIICPQVADERSLKLVRQYSDIPFIKVSRTIIRAVARFNPAQGIAAVVRQRWTSLYDVKPSNDLCWIATNGIQCPNNLGTLIRLSDAVGGAGIIMVGTSSEPDHPYADFYHPSVARASLGAIFSQRLVAATLPEFAEWKMKHGLHVVGTSPCGTKDYRAVEYKTPLVLFMGNEWKGLASKQQALCDILVRIPMTGRVPSLSVTTAAGIVLYEISGRRHACDFPRQMHDGRSRE